MYLKKASAILPNVIIKNTWWKIDWLFPVKSNGVDTEVLYLHIKVLSPRSFEFHFEAELLGGGAVVCIECFAVAKKPS